MKILESCFKDKHHTVSYHRITQTRVSYHKASTEEVAAIDRVVDTLREEDGQTASCTESCPGTPAREAENVMLVPGEQALLALPAPSPVRCAAFPAQTPKRETVRVDIDGWPAMFDEAPSPCASRVVAPSKRVLVRNTNLDCFSGCMRHISCFRKLFKLMTSKTVSHSSCGNHEV